MNEIHLTEEECLSDDEVAELKGEKIDESHTDRTIGGPDAEEVTKVYKPNGDVLAVLIPKAIPKDECYQAYTALRPAAISGGSRDGNRGTAAGKPTTSKHVKKDGTVSSTNKVPRQVNPNTEVVGYFDRSPRHPYCRQTAYAANHPEKFGAAFSMFQGAARAFQEHTPERYENQQSAAKETADDWVITKTPFTTVTVNLNWQTAVHTDAGDLEEGFGVMTVIRLGDYEGAHYIQPQYKTGYDLHTGDVILSDVHEWHGNGPFEPGGSSGYYERLSCVLYYREDMQECQSAAAETQHAQKAEDSRLHHGTLDYESVEIDDDNTDATEEADDGIAVDGATGATSEDAQAEAVNAVRDIDATEDDDPAPDPDDPSLEAANDADESVSEEATESDD